MALSPSVSMASKVAVIALAIGGAVYFGWARGSDETAQDDRPEAAAPYFCIECNEPFGLTPAGYERLSKSGGVKTISTAESRRGQLRFRCPKCDKFGGVPALKCPKDGTSIPNMSVNGQPIACPTCKWTP